jgi:hypothetical protein
MTRRWRDDIKILPGVRFDVLSATGMAGHGAALSRAPWPSRNR